MTTKLIYIIICIISFFTRLRQATVRWMEECETGLIDLTKDFSREKFFASDNGAFNFSPPPPIKISNLIKVPFNYIVF